MSNKIRCINGDWTNGPVIPATFPIKGQMVEIDGVFLHPTDGACFHLVGYPNDDAWWVANHFEYGYHVQAILMLLL